MIVKLSNGFEFSVVENVADDMELLDALVAIDRESDPGALTDAVRIIFGDQQKALYESYRDDDGRVPVTKITEAINEALEHIGDAGKKS